MGKTANPKRRTHIGANHRTKIIGHMWNTGEVLEAGSRLPGVRYTGLAIIYPVCPVCRAGLALVLVNGLAGEGQGLPYM
jgi:hypothetical protein